MADWLQEHRTALLWLSGCSVAIFVACLLAMPYILAKVPADYFAHPKRPPELWKSSRPGLRVPVRIVKNIAGWILLLLGVAMIVLPGPGVAGILIGLMMVDFPGKYRLERWLVSLGPVMRTMNWMRRRRGVAPFTM